MVRKLITAIYRQYLIFYYSKNLKIFKTSKLGFNKFRVLKDCKVIVGEKSLIQSNFYFDKPSATIIIGNRTFIGGSKLIAADRIVIGDDVLISWGCTLVDHDSHSLNFEERKEDVANWIEGRKDWRYVTIQPIIIKNKVWIGFDVKILKGVTIGEGAVVAAGSIVTKDVEPYTLVAGIPAKPIKKLGIT
jgi:acetyltransferase-like isoleucine patch superfamily enzyme